jgi:DNA-binding GntR family transcriptional regulator
VREHVRLDAVEGQHLIARVPQALCERAGAVVRHLGFIIYQCRRLRTVWARFPGIIALRMATDVSTVTPGGLIAERAYVELRDRIVTLRLAPGTVLREDALMAELGIGRTPLREAVKRLALENLVAVQPRRGTFVTDVDAADIVHITEVRAELEGYAAELAARRMDKDARAEARALLAEIERPGPGSEDEDHDALIRVDQRIHRFIWEASRNP